ncbi:hypothetical protein [Flavobacterium sp. N2038]|uniref:hypothetical protein n=1 Tax=Flavobacterium sp. N2038 TaxID=2986829 RepID=UPI002224FFD1|nr:hypothetical protein [Flavobacterium sp. N2038]
MPIEPFDFTYSLTSQSEENEVLNTLGKGRIKEFEPKSYFFTESTIAAQSTAEGAYGPDFVSTNTKFNITTQFELANKKAYAVTSGQVLIVPQSGDENESKVNVFIKPLKNVDVGVQIKYYVYRGLKKELFINSNNNILPKSSANTLFMAKVWTDLVNFNELKEPLPEISASLFGYNTTETDTNSLDAKFFNTYDVTSTDENKAYNLPIIEAGQYFGEFQDNKGGFEIVLNDGFYYQEKSDTGFQFDLKYARAEKAVLDLAEIASDPNISEKIYRENVQKFLDPAAFYGAHITEKEKGKVKFVDDSTEYSSRVDIFNHVINKFYNKHKCYIYIQGNTGRSFNFDESLGADPIKIGISEILAVGSYKTNDWPIIINEFEQTHSSDENENKKKNNNLSFQLKFKTAEKNVTLYNTHGNCSNTLIQGKFLGNKALIDDNYRDTQEYTNNVNFRLINNYSLSDNPLVTKNIATFIYINHEEKEVEYFNNFFGPVKIDHLRKTNQSSQYITRKSSNTKIKIKNSYIDGKSIASNVNFTTIPYSNSSNQTPNEDKFKIYISKKIDSENSKEPTFKRTTSLDITDRTIKTSDDYSLFEYGDKNYKIWKGQVDNNGETIKTLQLINFEEEGNVTNFMHLGLMNDDYNKVVYNSLTSTTTNHIPESYSNFYFHLEMPVSSVQDGLVKKYILGVKAEKYLGLVSEIIYPSPENTVYVYTVDGHYFFTKEFAEKFTYTEEFSSSRVNFKPKYDKIQGSGFDWMRLTSEFTPPFEPSEYGYEDSILGGYGFINKTDAYQNLKREYTTITTKQNNLYFVPYLNTIAGTPENISDNFSYITSLTATVDIQEKLTNLELDYDHDLFEISTNLPIDLSPGKKEFDIEIICKKEFQTDKSIKFIAFSQLNGELPMSKLAGVIKVLKNSKENQKKIKIVLINLKTDVAGYGYPETGEIEDIEKINLKKILFQAKIAADIESYTSIDKNNKVTHELDLTNDSKFKSSNSTSGGYVKSNGTAISIVNSNGGINDEKQDYLKKLIDEKYKNHFKVYAFGIPCNDAGGNVQEIGKHSVCLYFNRTPVALAHEVCHGLGLFHTHIDGSVTDERQKYVYPYSGDEATEDAKKRGTDNIMCYNQPISKSTWQWQWKIMHDNIKNYIYED